jgi:hypothetical protein
MNWTPEQLKEAEQRIQAKCQVRKVESPSATRKYAKPKKRHEDWGKRLQVQCADSGLPVPELEYHFYTGRRWRFDDAWPAKKIAVEIEGGVWVNGRHTRGQGFEDDMEKYNHAAKLGWRIFRFTPSQVGKLKAVEFMKGVLGGLF